MRSSPKTKDTPLVRTDFSDDAAWTALYAAVTLFHEGKSLTTLDDDVERLFGILAPFVTPGSCLAIQGEEGTCWRYVFKKGKLRVEQMVTIIVLGA